MDVEKEGDCGRIDALVHARDQVLPDEIQAASRKELEPDGKVSSETEKFAISFSLVRLLKEEDVGEPDQVGDS